MKNKTKARFLIRRRDGIEKKVTVNCQNFVDAEKQLYENFNAAAYKPIYFGWCKFDWENMEWEEIEEEENV